VKTHIVLNDDLVEEAMRYARAKSRKALIEEALRTFVEIKEAEKRRTHYRERLQSLDSRLQAIHLSESPAKVLRADRDRR